MTRISFPVDDKDVEEVDNLTFDYSRNLVPLETLVSAVVTVTVVSGSDAAPAAMLSGGAQVQDPTVIQKITGGVKGTSYDFRCVATTSNGRSLTLAATMNVVML